MNTTVKTAWIIVLSGVLLFAIVGPLMARPVWMRGTVTRAPWVDSDGRVEIDHQTYTLVLEDDTFERHFLDSSKTCQAEKFPIAQLLEGKKVVFRTEDRRIYVIYLAE